MNKTEPGRSFSWLDVTTRLDGSTLRIPVHTATGAHPGPTLTITSALHGSEWHAIDVIRYVLDNLDCSQMHGRLVAIPVANPVAFEHLTRNTPDESDEPDLNRVFPGGEKWVTTQMAKAIADNVLSQTDCLIDFHCGIWGSVIAEVGYGHDVPNSEVRDRAAGMARAYGYPCIRKLNMMGAFPGPRAIAAYCMAKLGKPAISTSLGGEGFDPALEAGWFKANTDGVFNVLKYLGILDGKLELPKRYFTFVGRGYRVVPTKGGMLEPVVPVTALHSEVQAGQLLGRVRSPHTFEVLEELRSPVRGVLFGACRAYPVWPGDWAYFVAGLDDPGSEWVEE